MKYFIFLVLSLLPTFTYSNQVYDNSLNDSVFDRISIYFNKTATNSYERLNEVNTNTKIFVNELGTVRQFTSMGETEKLLANNYIGTDKLLSRINS